MVEVSKTVADRLTFSEQVIQAVEVQGAQVADAITNSLGASLPREVVVRAVMGWLGRHLRGAHDALREADLAHAMELTDDAMPRRARDEANAALRASLIAASNVVSGTYGEAFSDSVGLEAPLQVRPDLLVAQSRGIVRAVRGAAAPAPITPGATVDLAALSHGIEVTASALADSLASVLREEREAQGTLSTRDEAMSRFERVYAGVAEIFSGFCTLAGFDDLSAKARPTARRRAGIPDELAKPVTPTV